MFVASTGYDRQDGSGATELGLVRPSPQPDPVQPGLGRFTLTRRPGLTRRGLVGLLILGAHVGIVAMFAAGTGVPREREDSPPVIVDFLQEQPSKLDPPALSDPKLVVIAPPEVEPPIESLSIETEVHSAITTDAPAAPTPAAITTKGSGSPVLAELSDVAYVEPPAPRYPPESKRAREEGRVVLRVLIDETGHARSVNVHRSSGHRRLDEAACEAIQRALFRPFVEGGSAHAAVAIIPVEFSLNGSGDRRRRGS